MSVVIILFMDILWNCYHNNLPSVRIFTHSYIMHAKTPRQVCDGP